jgi:hypothetical protein
MPDRSRAVSTEDVFLGDYGGYMITLLVSDRRVGPKASAPSPRRIIVVLALDPTHWMMKAQAWVPIPARPAGGRRISGLSRAGTS